MFVSVSSSSSSSSSNIDEEGGGITYPQYPNQSRQSQRTLKKGQRSYGCSMYARLETPSQQSGWCQDEDCSNHQCWIKILVCSW